MFALTNAELSRGQRTEYAPRGQVRQPARTTLSSFPVKMILDPIHAIYK